ncbi:MAG TPA: hypothetical protein VI357_14555 [Mycobacteriales bacterium]
MDAFTPIVVAVGAGAVATAVRTRRLRNPWTFMVLAKANNRHPVRAEDGVLGGSTQQAVDLLADKHFGGSFERVTLGDLFPVLCSPEWTEATAVMLGCLIRHNRVPRSFRPPGWGQYELLRAYWVPRPSRRRDYARPRTAVDYVQLASTYAALRVQAEDGAIERVPAEWFRGHLRARNGPAEEAPIGVLLRSLEPGEGSPAWQQDAANSRRCITGRLKREAVLDPEFDDDVPELEPDRFAAAFRVMSRREIRQS